mmetsp:Transcript_106744/g.309664  ORF Transcript_106744/g.309664 Transcript_106744/m.309664 type:complete len:268 (+) Transcript_106744:282-1085(+)
MALACGALCCCACELAWILLVQAQVRSVFDGEPPPPPPSPAGALPTSLFVRVSALGGLHERFVEILLELVILHQRRLVLLQAAARALRRVRARAVADEAGHDDDESEDVEWGDRAGVGHEGQREREVADRHHDCHGEPEEVGRAPLEDHNDEDVVRDVEEEVHVHERRCQGAVVRRARAVVAVVVVVVVVALDRALANIAEQPVVEVARQLARVDRRAGDERGWDGERDREGELEEGDPRVEVDRVEVRVAKGNLLVHRRQDHWDRR